MNPLPTPYDIAPIPYFPYSPGPLLWCGCLVFFALIIALAFRPRRTSKHRIKDDRDNPIRDAENAIERLSRSMRFDREELFHASRRLKKVFKVYEGLDYSSMSPLEIARSADISKGDEFSKLFNSLLMLEKLKFQANVSQDDLKGTSLSCLSSLRSYRHLIQERESPKEREAK